MADLYSDVTMAERNANTARERSGFEKLIRLFLIVACFSAVIILVWFTGITPFRPFSRIDVTPLEGLTPELILTNSGIKNGASFISTDARAMEKALAKLPQIASVQVYKYFPDRLEIVLEGRKAVAMALAQSYGKTYSVYFDAQGVVFRIGAGEEDASHGLPLLSGLVIDNPVLGMRLPPALVPLLSELENIRTKSPVLLSAISEIRIDQRNINGFDLIIYPAHRQIKVRLSELNEDILRYTLLMVDVLAEREPGISYIDFRSGMASYNNGNGNNGMGGFHD